jgi:hypothetical protein
MKTNIYLENEIFSEKYSDDALHTAIASSNQIGILLKKEFYSFSKNQNTPDGCFN